VGFVLHQDNPRGLIHAAFPAHAHRDARSRTRGPGVDLAGRRCGAAAVLVRLRTPVRGRSASRDRGRGLPGRGRAGSGSRRGRVRGHGPGQRPLGDDPDRRRLVGHAHAPGLGRGRRGRDCRRRRRRRDDRAVDGARGGRAVRRARRACEYRRRGLRRPARAVADAVGSASRRCAGGHGRVAAGGGCRCAELRDASGRGRSCAGPDRGACGPGVARSRGSCSVGFGCSGHVRHAPAGDGFVSYIRSRRARPGDARLAGGVATAGVGGRACRAGQCWCSRCRAPSGTGGSGLGFPEARRAVGGRGAGRRSSSTRVNGRASGARDPTGTRQRAGPHASAPCRAEASACCPSEKGAQRGEATRISDPAGRRSQRRPRSCGRTRGPPQDPAAAPTRARVCRGRDRDPARRAGHANTRSYHWCRCRTT